MKQAKDSLLPIWQPLGYSTNKISKNAGAIRGTLATHTGTLDPMAEGVIIVLTGEERYKKYDLASWKKTYEFEILTGISTDSYDTMGLITKKKLKRTDVPSTDELGRIISGFQGPYTQRVPIYSAIRYKGKKLFEHAQAGTNISSLPVKKGEIYKIELLGIKEANLSKVIPQIVSRLKCIRGDFRQEKIITQWEELEKKSDNARVCLIKVRVQISRGMYVRSLSQDICKAAGITGTVFSLKRTKNGVYSKSKCLTLEEVFGQNLGVLH
jgi:tRNA pseudouridine55 synthase